MIMEYGKWIKYEPSMEIEDGTRVLILRNGYGKWFELAQYNKHYECFDDSEGDDYFCDLTDVDKIFIIPNIE